MTAAVTGAVTAARLPGPRLALPGAPPSQRRVDAVLADLAALGEPGAGWGHLEVHRPAPTAAFSRRDALAGGFGQAQAAASARGFAPVVRPAGGRLAAYHGGALVLDVVARHPDPRADVRPRFAALGACLAAALRALGVDARVGAVPGEYCPGEFSVNARGATKIVGTAQRLTRRACYLSAVVLVEDAEPVRAVLSEAYPLIGLDWDPRTVGCVADEVPGASVEEVRAVLLEHLGRLLPLALPHPPGPPHLLDPAGAAVLRVPLDARWDASWPEPG
ncbi:lipoate--protein ligase family protein [Quadrisphaera sp. DSM 44207]|uniref:lipoyl protein ligase domain-containing protein n=1 Tax=Quadrisphaera sp. DSM 44207 TaxID=1881057 RepID=UPI00115FB0E8|nr:lipoate--protein ligase family protein [Quadrisphaera sp. DSM 44207]